MASEILTLAARPGADSTSWDFPAEPTGLAAMTPCSVTGPAPLINAPGAPGGPPDSSSTAVNGTLAEILIEPGFPLREGIETAVVVRPSTGMLLPPVGWYEPRGVIAVTLTLAAAPPGTVTNSSRVPAVAGRPVSTWVVEGSEATGSHVPALRVWPVTRIAAITRPVVVVT